MALSAAEIVAFAMPVLIAGGMLGHHLRANRRRKLDFQDFEARWKARATLVLEGRIWRSGGARQAIVALAHDRIAIRAAGTRDDIEVPLALVRAGGVRERRDGTRLLDLSLPGDQFYLEVAPGFIDELVDRLAGRR